MNNSFNKLIQKFSNSGNFPNQPPNRNYIPFENPRDKCKVPFCPNFAYENFDLCLLHCKKLHVFDHLKKKNITVENLIEKYLSKHKIRQQKIKSPKIKKQKIS